MQITLPIIPYGADQLLAKSGSIRQGDASGTKVVTLTVPQDVAPDTPSMEIHLSPSIATVMIDALPYLLQYPYGCTEQTISRFLPAVIVRRTLQQLGIDLADVGAKIEQQGEAAAKIPNRRHNNPVFNNALMNDMIQTGLRRLAKLQRPDGGWGWWAEGMSNPYMSAYVVYGLAEAVAADVAIDRAMLERGVEFLLNRVVSPEDTARRSWQSDDDNVRAWMLYSLATHDPNLLDRVHRDARQRALQSLGLHEMQTELDGIQQQQSVLEKRERQIGKAMLAHVRGIPVDDLDDYSTYRHDREVDNAVARRQAVHEEELLAETETGLRILKLRQEKDNLLDTVWLATVCQTYIPLLLRLSLYGRLRFICCRRRSHSQVSIRWWGVREFCSCG